MEQSLNSVSKSGHPNVSLNGRSEVMLAEELINTFSFVSFSKPRSLLYKVLKMCWHRHSHPKLELADTGLSCFVKFLVS